MDAGVFLSMDSLHRPAAHITAWPQACGFYTRKTKQEGVPLRKGSQTVVSAFAYPHGAYKGATMHICTLGNS